MNESRLKILVIFLLLVVSLLVLERVGIIPSGIAGPNSVCSDGGDGPNPATPEPLGPANINALGLAEITTVTPDTPAGQALAWGIAQLNLGLAGATEETVREHVAPSLLETMSAAELANMFHASAMNGPYALVGFKDAPADLAVRAAVRLPNNDYIILDVAVEAEAPNRLTRFTIDDSI
jgi:hypothetical protein